MEEKRFWPRGLRVRNRQLLGDRPRRRPAQAPGRRRRHPSSLAFMLHVETHAMSVFSAAAAGQLDVVCTLLDEGAKLDARDSDGRTALHHAAANGHAVVVQSLLERGARFDTFDEGNWSPLHSAAAAGRAEVVAYLIAAGTDIDASAASSGSTALVLAASKGRTDVVRVLLGKGANPLATDASGATALHRAAGKGELAIIGATRRSSCWHLDRRARQGRPNGLPRRSDPRARGRLRPPGRKGC